MNLKEKAIDKLVEATFIRKKRKPRTGIRGTSGENSSTRAKTVITVAPFSPISNIQASYISDGISGPRIGFTKNDLKKWKYWYSQNKHTLSWISKEKKVAFKKEYIHLKKMLKIHIK